MGRTAQEKRFLESKKLRSLFDDLGVRASFGRPYTSNDNAFAESVFATFRSLDFVTPQSVHEGLHPEILANRNSLLEINRLAHPSRHGGKSKTYGILAEARLKHRTLMTVAA